MIIQVTQQHIDDAIESRGINDEVRHSQKCPVARALREYFPISGVGFNTLHFYDTHFSYTVSERIKDFISNFDKRQYNKCEPIKIYIPDEFFIS